MEVRLRGSLDASDFDALGCYRPCPINTGNPPGIPGDWIVRYVYDGLGRLVEKSTPVFGGQNETRRGERANGAKSRCRMKTHRIRIRQRRRLGRPFNLHNIRNRADVDRSVSLLLPCSGDDCCLNSLQRVARRSLSRPIA